MTMDDEQEIAGVLVQELKDELLFYVRNLDSSNQLSFKEARLEMERRLDASFAKKKEDKIAFKRILGEVIEIIEEEEEEVSDEDEDTTMNQSSNSIKNSTIKSFDDKDEATTSSSKSSSQRLSHPSDMSSEESTHDKLLSELLERKRSREKRLRTSLGYTQDTQVSQQSKWRDAMSTPGSSVWKQVDVTQSMFLLPADFEDVENSIVSFLNGRLMKFRNDVGGVLCAYSDLRIMGSKVPISYSGKPMTPPFLYAPFTQFRITYKALLFVPVPQVTLWGEIKTTSSEHMGMVCYGLFNATVPGTSMGTDFIYSHPHKAWMHQPTGKKLYPGTQVPFKVNSYDTKGLLHIFGILEEGNWIHKVDDSKPQSQQEQPEQQEKEQEQEQEPKLKQEVKQEVSQEKNEENATTPNEPTMMDVDSKEKEKKKVKKEKKPKIKKEKKKDKVKKGKKRKASEMMNGDNNNTETAEEPVKKKKKISSQKSKKPNEKKKSSKKKKKDKKKNKSE